MRIILEKRLAVRLNITTDYNGVGKIQYIAAERGIMTLDTQYTDKVALTFLVPVKDAPAFQAALTEGTNGKAKIQTVCRLYYGNLEKEILIFEEIP